jgi:protein-S-isoprenylcysteine O-methyltransferase Ste14
MSARKHLRAVLLLPFAVTIAVPAALTWLAGSLPVGWGLQPPLNLLPIALGLCLLAIGVALMAQTVHLFASVGRGTLAPWNPPRRLVVRGPYRRVRNPMIAGVFLILLGEAALLGSIPILCWLGAFALGNAIYMPLVEEPDLVRRFGQDYVEYRNNVPAWIPRLCPWEPDMQPDRDE